MRHAFVRPLLGLGLLGIGAASPAHDALLEQALQRSALPAGELQGSLRTTTIIRGGKQPETETKTVDLRQSPDKALASYAELKAVIGEDAHIVGQEAGRTLYAFTTRRLPRGSTGDGRINISDDGGHDDQLFDGRAEVSLDAGGRPYVSHLDLRLPKAEGSLLARIRRIDISYAFAPAPQGDAITTTAVTADVDVRALLFVHRQVHAESVLLASRTP